MGKAPSKPVKTAKSSSVSRDLSGRTECTSVAASTRAPKQRKRRINQDDFIDDYKLCIRDALIKLVRRAVPANKLGRRECCAVLWECFRKFQRDVTSLKLADARLMLNEAIANEKQKFDATAAFCLDTLDAAHLAQNRIAGIAARQKVPPSKSDTTATSTAKQSDNCSMQNDNNNAASRVCGVAEASKAQNNISADAVPPGSAAATAGQGDRAVAPGGQAAVHGFVLPTQSPTQMSSDESDADEKENMAPRGRGGQGARKGRHPRASTQQVHFDLPPGATHAPRTRSHGERTGIMREEITTATAPATGPRSASILAAASSGARRRASSEASGVVRSRPKRRRRATRRYAD